MLCVRHDLKRSVICWVALSPLDTVTSAPQLSLSGKSLILTCTEESCEHSELYVNRAASVMLYFVSAEFL